MNTFTPYNIVFAGTPAFAQIVLQKLLANKQPITAVYTQPDRPAGRGRLLTSSPVKQLAEQYQLPVMQPTTCKDETFAKELSQHSPDILLVVAYGMILPAHVLAIPKLGCINVHPSLLPAWRGSTPIQQAILAGDTSTGVTIMQMNERLDAGNIIQQCTVPILPTDTSGSLHQQLAELAGDMLLQLFQNASWSSYPQDETQATFSAKITKERTWLPWRLSAVELDRYVRAFHPLPGAMSFLHQQPIKIWRARPKIAEVNAIPGTIVAQNETIDVATGNGILQIQELQLPGGKSLTARAILNARGEWFAPGNQFI
jgi:methionyl-tRNA formyltransferase